MSQKNFYSVFFLRNGRLPWLKRHNFVGFKYISTKIGGNVYIWLFTDQRWYVRLYTVFHL